MSLVFYGEPAVYDPGNESGGGIGYGSGCGAGVDFWGEPRERMYGEIDEQNGGDIEYMVLAGTGVTTHYGCGTLENCGDDRGNGKGQLMGFTTTGSTATVPAVSGDSEG